METRKRNMARCQWPSQETWSPFEMSVYIYRNLMQSLADEVAEHLVHLTNHPEQHIGRWTIPKSFFSCFMKINNSLENFRAVDLNRSDFIENKDNAYKSILIT